MTTMMIKGVRFTLTAETAEEIRKAMEAEEAERRAAMQDYEDLMGAAAACRETGDWSFYSDVYKDIYGVRPRSFPF